MADTSSDSSVCSISGITAGQDGAKLTETLREIAQVCTIHYVGGAFDPEHMRAIANAAIFAVNGGSIDDKTFDWKDYPDPYHVQELEEYVQKQKKRLKRAKARLEVKALEKHVVMLQKRHAKFDQNRSTWMQKDCIQCSYPMMWDVGWINDLSADDVDGVKCWSCGTVNSLKRTLFDKLEPCTEGDNIATSYQPPCQKQ